MGMNPNTNKFEQLSPELYEEMTKAKYDKEGLTLFRVGEHVELNGYIWVVNKIDNLSKPNRLILVPVGPVETKSQVSALGALQETVDW